MVVNHWKYDKRISILQHYTKIQLIMKYTILLCRALLFLFLISPSFILAQAPSVSINAGYPVGTSAREAAYGNGKYIVLSSQNMLYQSTDAVAWNMIQTTGLATSQLNSIIYANGKFVIAGNSGVIQTSLDGITWVTQTSGTANNLSRLYYVNSKFFAIGFNRTLLTSADGITWSTITINTGTATDFFVSLAYGNGWYVLGARSNSGGSSAIVYRSSTAANNSWTSATDTPSWNGTNRIQFLKDKFWAFMIGNRMFTSPDGNTWTEITSSVVLTQPNSTTTSWNTSHQIFNGVWDGTKYSFYGSSQYYSGYGSTFTSTDGTNFTLLNKTAYIVPQESAIVNGIYFVCGNEGFVTSTDALVYSHSGMSANAMVKTDNKYVAVGMLSNDGLIYNSTDFTTWTNRSPAALREMYAVDYDGANVVAAGSQKVLRSTDEGDTWSTVYTDVNETFNAMAFGNGKFVASGYDASNMFIRYSSDAGETWTTVNNDNDWILKIKYVNNNFFALGMNNDDWTARILYSPDGISWTDVTPNLGYEVYYFKDVTYDGSKYHFLGIESSGGTPTGFFTVSTATPATPASYTDKAVCTNIPPGVVLGGNWDQGSLDFSNGKFTGSVIDAVTGQDYIIYSLNGTSWTALPQYTYSSVMSTYVSGNTVQMLGRANAFFTLNYNITLPVNLLTFTGKLSESVVNLNWVTASEENTKQFIVQHSTDGRTWKQAGIVGAAGNSSVRKEYTFTHTSPAAGINFYRLLQQDIDGKSTISKVVTITTATQKITWYPNPVMNEINIRIPGGGTGSILFFNSNGQVVKQATITGSETKIDLSSLSKGIYIAEITKGNQKQTIRISKN